MEASDAKKFKALLDAVADSYGKQVTNGMRDLYWEAFSKYPYPEVRRAFSAHVMHPDHGRFWPKPADIVRQIDGDSASGGLIALEKLKRAIRTIGPHRDVVFDDPLIHACVEQLGGWIAVNEWTDEELGYRGNEFQKLYTGLYGKDVPYSAILRGIAHNSLSEHNMLPAPLLVGDREKAQQVMIRGQDKPRLQVTRAARELVPVNP